MEVVKKKRMKKLAVPAVAKTAGLSERELQVRQPALPGYRVRLGQGASIATVGRRVCQARATIGTACLIAYA